MNPTPAEVLRWLACRHDSVLQVQNEDHIAWRCEDCGLSRVKWLGRSLTATAEASSEVTADQDVSSAGVVPGRGASTRVSLDAVVRFLFDDGKSVAAAKVQAEFEASS